MALNVVRERPVTVVHSFARTSASPQIGSSSSKNSLTRGVKQLMCGSSTTYQESSTKVMPRPNWRARSVIQKPLGLIPASGFQKGPIKAHSVRQSLTHNKASSNFNGARVPALPQRPNGVRLLNSDQGLPSRAIPKRPCSRSLSVMAPVRPSPHSPALTSRSPIFPAPLRRNVVRVENARNRWGRPFGAGVGMAVSGWTGQNVDLEPGPTSSTISPFAPFIHVPQICQQTTRKSELPDDDAEFLAVVEQMEAAEKRLEEIKRPVLSTLTSFSDEEDDAFMLLLDYPVDLVEMGEQVKKPVDEDEYSFMLLLDESNQTAEGTKTEQVEKAISTSLELNSPSVLCNTVSAHLQRLPSHVPITLKCSHTEVAVVAGVPSVPTSAGIKQEALNSPIVPDGDEMKTDIAVSREEQCIPYLQGRRSSALDNSENMALLSSVELRVRRKKLRKNITDLENTALSSAAPLVVATSGRAPKRSSDINEDECHNVETRNTNLKPQKKRYALNSIPSAAPRADNCKPTPPTLPTDIPTTLTRMPISTRRQLSEPALLLVLDTNIVLRKVGLDFLEDVVESRFDDVLPRLQVVVPHILLLELDRQQKDRRWQRTDRRQKDRCRELKDLANSARLAVKRLNVFLQGPPLFTQERPRLIGQTAEEHTDAEKKYLRRGGVDDDHFLYCCIQRRADCDISGESVVLPLTNDINLQTRMRANKFKVVFSIDQLLKSIADRRFNTPSPLDRLLDRKG